jgi:dUTP pyrophosphatase
MLPPVSLKIKRLNDIAVIPKYAKAGDAGLDLVATSYERKDGRHVYGTGLAIEIPEGYVGLLFPRSSICKYDLRLSNAVGVIDSGYRGELSFAFENDNIKPREKFIDGMYTRFRDRLYKVGDRIGQLIVMPIPVVQIQEITELSDTERGTGGYGSSGA